MSWSITIKSGTPLLWESKLESIASLTLPDPQEPIVSVSDCPGNFFTALEDFRQLRLDRCSRAEAIAGLRALITEIDYGNEGFFSDAYAIESDQKWSNGRETETEFREYERMMKMHPGIVNALPFYDYATFCGHRMRKSIRDASLRFFFYYLAGYEVTFTW